METAKPNLFTRDDTFLGICQGLGEDLRVNPDLFRVAIIPALFFFPLQTLAAYFGAGVVVFLSRLIFPVRGRRAKTGGKVHVAKPASVAEREPAAAPELEMAA